MATIFKVRSPQITYMQRKQTQLNQKDLTHSGDLIMKLTYRGNFYQVPASIQLVSNYTEQPKIKLVYRGNAIDYISRPVVIWESDKTNCPTMNLIYRGNSYERKCQTAPQAPSKAQYFNVFN